MKSYISDRGTKKLDEIPNILWSITSGLEHLHQKDIVHGRLCLANVSVFKRGSETMVKLSNYGLQQWEVTGQVHSLMFIFTFQKKKILTQFSNYFRK